jgi:two-component system, NarL family, invasion response regulator UvrY
VEGLTQLPAGSAARMALGLRILVVEGHALVGAALSGLLREPPLAAHVEIVHDGETAIACLESTTFDLIICELSVPTTSASVIMSRLAAMGSGARVVFLSDADEEQLLLDALTSGAAGFFTKDCAPEEFIRGINSVLDGNYAFGRRLMPGMMARLGGARKVTTRR